MLKIILSPLSANVKSSSRHSASSLRASVSLASANALMRVGQIKNKFLMTQLTSLRTQVYATMRQGGASHAHALAEIDRALREVAASFANASKLATDAAAQADRERSSS